MEETTFDIAQEEFARKDLKGTYLNAAGYYLVKAFPVAEAFIKGVY